MAGNIVCLVQKIGRFNRGFTESQVRHGDAAGLFGVVVKVCLCIQIGIIADNLDGVLICADGTVGTKAPELTAGCTGRSRIDSLAERQRQVGNIIADTDGKFFFRLCSVQVFKYRNQLRRCRVLRTKTEASADNHRCALAVLIQVADI